MIFSRKQHKTKVNVQTTSSYLHAAYKQVTADREIEQLQDHVNALNANIGAKVPKAAATMHFDLQTPGRGVLFGGAPTKPAGFQQQHPGGGNSGQDAQAPGHWEPPTNTAPQALAPQAAPAATPAAADDDNIIKKGKAHESDEIRVESMPNISTFRAWR